MQKYLRLSSAMTKLEELGLASAVLRKAGLSRPNVGQPYVFRKTEEWFAFWQAISKVSTSPAIGIQTRHRKQD